MAQGGDRRSRHDPTILPALVAVGYDRSFELLDEHEADTCRGVARGRPRDRPRARAGASASRPVAAVDLGGIGKGFARRPRARCNAGRVAVDPPGGLADLGGDIAVLERPPEGGPWRLAVADPREPGSTLGVLELEAGGVATSGRDTQALRSRPGRLHHLIDPATGSPAGSGPLAVTVVAPDAPWSPPRRARLRWRSAHWLLRPAAYVEARPNHRRRPDPRRGRSWSSSATCNSMREAR